MVRCEDGGGGGGGEGREYDLWTAGEQRDLPLSLWPRVDGPKNGRRLPSTFLKNANVASMESLTSTEYFFAKTTFSSRAVVLDINAPKVGALGLFSAGLPWELLCLDVRAATRVENTGQQEGGR